MSQGTTTQYTEEKKGGGRGIGAPPVAGLARLVGLYIFFFHFIFPDF
jgi:hypothetical protein